MSGDIEQSGSDPCFGIGPKPLPGGQRKVGTIVGKAMSVLSEGDTRNGRRQICETQRLIGEAVFQVNRRVIAKIFAAAEPEQIAGRVMHTYGFRSDSISENQCRKSKVIPKAGASEN